MARRLAPLLLILACGADEQTPRASWPPSCAVREAHPLTSQGMCEAEAVETDDGAAGGAHEVLAALHSAPRADRPVRAPRLGTPTHGYLGQRSP